MCQPFWEPPNNFECRFILILVEKLAELVSFIREDNTKALSVHSTIESNFHVCHLNRKSPWALPRSYPVTPVRPASEALETTAHTIRHYCDMGLVPNLRLDEHGHRILTKNPLSG